MKRNIEIHEAILKLDREIAELKKEIARKKAEQAKLISEFMTDVKAKYEDEE